MRGQQFGAYPGSYTLVASNEVRFDPSVNFLPGEFVAVSLSESIQTTNAIPLEQHHFEFHVATVFCTNHFFRDVGQSMGGSRSRGVALGDLDGDGDLDAFAANDFEANRVWMNTGLGSFTNSGQTLGVRQSMAVELGDLDGDGDVDAWVANRTGGSKVWLNNGSGQFSLNGQNLGLNQGWDVALGDLNGDGALDAIVATGDSDFNEVWLNDGAGQFSSGGSLSTNDLRGVALGDLDGDGDLDAILACRTVPHQVWFNDGNGVLSNSGQLLDAEPARDVVLGDLDGDGDLDAVFASATNQVWLNDGAGGFSDSGQLLGTRPIERAALGDLDGDGDLDLYAAYDANKPNLVWLNVNGVFTSNGQGLGERNSEDIRLGDIDRDGDLDAFVANYNGGNRVWLNEGCSNGIVDLAIAKSSSSLEIETGSNLTYTIVVTNIGFDAASNVMVSEMLPSGAVFVSASPSPDSQAGQLLQFNLGEVPAGARRSIAIDVIVVTNARPELTNRVAVATDSTEYYLGDNTAEVVNLVWDFYVASVTPANGA
ncbi:MAG: FG-GAP-like repeat-containing protein, partial [Verrucomicrobiota bacterium]